MGAASRIGSFYSGNSIVLAVVIVLVSLLVSAFNSYYFISTVSDQRAQEIAALFNASDKGFSDTAKSILNSRTDILYVKLLNPEGVLLESFGNGEGENIDIIPLTAPENNTILLGITAKDYKTFMLSSLLWSGLIGIAVSVILLFTLSFFSSGKSDSLEKLISGMKSVTRGDLAGARVDPGEYSDDVTTMRAFETFNQMVERLRRKEDLDEDIPVFQPTLIASGKEDEDEYAEARHRNVTVMVAKIADFQELSNTLDPAEFNSFLADYRKAASAIISNYGGVIEALLKDEIVAFFNAPEEQVHPELKAVSSAVEVLQLLAGITRERKLEGKTAISGKIGIGLKSVPVFSEDSVPHGIREITDIARHISTIAPIWRVIVSPDVYSMITEYVDARELKLGTDSYYSVVGVEEGVA